MKLNGKIMDFFLLHLVVAHKVKPLSIKMLLIVSDNCDVYSLTAKELEYISKIILREFKNYINYCGTDYPRLIQRFSNIVGA